MLSFPASLGDEITIHRCGRETGNYKITIIDLNTAFTKL
jgi:hypothetical protein